MSKINNKLIISSSVKKEKPVSILHRIPAFRVQIFLSIILTQKTREFFIAFVSSPNSKAVDPSLAVKMILVYNIAFALIFAGIVQSADEYCRGCVSLDSYSFNKVTSKFKAVLVKFDVAFPYGEQHEEFAKVAQMTRNSVDLLVAVVGIKDYGQKENSDLAQRFAITKQDYPAVRLFLQGKSEPIPFINKLDSDFTAENLKRFVRTQSDIYLGLPGCVEQLDRLAEEFKTAQDKERQEILSKAKIFEETLPEEHRKAAHIYVKTMEKIIEKGDVFVQLEQSRLEGLLNGKISEDKKRYMKERRNILQSFAHRDEL